MSKQLVRHLTNAQLAEISVKKKKYTDGMLSREYKVSMDTVNKALLVISRVEFDRKKMKGEIRFKNSILRQQRFERRKIELKDEIFNSDRVVYRKKPKYKVVVDQLQYQRKRMKKYAKENKMVVKKAPIDDFGRLAGKAKEKSVGTAVGLALMNALSKQ